MTHVAESLSQGGLRQVHDPCSGIASSTPSRCSHQLLPLVPQRRPYRRARRRQRQSIGGADGGEDEACEV